MKFLNNRSIPGISLSEMIAPLVENTMRQRIEVYLLYLFKCKFRLFRQH